MSEGEDVNDRRNAGLSKSSVGGGRSFERADCGFGRKLVDRASRGMVNCFGALVCQARRATGAALGRRREPWRARRLSALYQRAKEAKEATSPTHPDGQIRRTVCALDGPAGESYIRCLPAPWQRQSGPTAVETGAAAPQ